MDTVGDINNGDVKEFFKETFDVVDMLEIVAEQNDD